MSKVFGIGWAKTGTKTLGECLTILGYNHQSRRLDLAEDLRTGDLSRILALVRQKDSFEDWPWLLLYREFDQAFPSSRFILTQRNPERWLRSYQNLLEEANQSTKQLNEIRSLLYGLPFPNVSPEQLQERYLRHNQEVVDYFKDRPQQLLIIDWESGDGWQSLCKFLGKGIPQAPFPHANRGNYTPLQSFLATNMAWLAKRLPAPYRTRIRELLDF